MKYSKAEFWRTFKEDGREPYCDAGLYSCKSSPALKLDRIFHFSDKSIPRNGIRIFHFSGRTREDPTIKVKIIFFLLCVASKLILEYFAC